MKSHIKGIAAGVIFSGFALPAIAQHATCAQTGPESPGELHKEWIMNGWERRAGDPPYDFTKKLGKFYDLENPRGVFWDNFAPGDSQLFHDGLAYGNNWKSLQDAAKSVSHGLTDAGSALVGDNAASTTLGFVGRLERLSGEIVAFDARSQLGWKCTSEGWKIQQELNYAWVVEPTAIERYIGKRN